MRITIVLMCVAAAFAACPHEETRLQSFSTSDLATGITKSSNISITSSILLDQDLDVSYIDISGSGKLVFGRGKSITVKSLGIMVRDNAALVIGSDDCRHTDKVNIILQGERDTDLDHSNEGQKYIAVKDEGSLLIHGAEKLHWTKLTSTAQRHDVDLTKVFYSHKNSDYASSYSMPQGLSLYILDGTTLQPKSFSVQDFWKGGVKTNEEKQILRFNEKLDALVTGDIVAMSVQNCFRMGSTTDVSPLFDKIESVANMTNNTLLLRTSEEYDAFSIIFVKGSNDFPLQAVDYKIGKKTTYALASIQYGAYKISAISYIYPGSGLRSYIDLRILTLDLGYPTISVLDDISSWNIGDEILLTSTDYSYTHAEVRRIKAKPTTQSIQLDGELEYRHYGEVEERVDMRGEVALLTRNIKIQGELSRGCPESNGNCDDVRFDSFGGHIKVMSSFGAVAIEGAELQFMGQATKLGFYPIHFHMCLNVTGKTSLVKRNSIHNTYARAVTVHGTYGTDENNLGVSVIENVAYDIFGHAYFTEDGIEIATKFEGNLGANVKAIKNGFSSDSSKASVFWITNPKVLMLNNVAAGAAGFGIWYVFPLSPVGPSAGMVYDDFEARHTPLWTFDNNVVHSCVKGGMNFDNILLDEIGSVTGCMNYKAVSNPLDPDSEPVKVQLTRLTAYKNKEINCWLRGGYFELIQYSSAESQRGVQLARASDQQQFMKKSVIMGKSTGNFEDTSYPDRTSVAHYLGVVFYDGPVYIMETAFLGFYNDPNGAFVSGALGFKPKNIFSSSAASTVSDLRFGYSDKTGGNRIFDGTIDDEDLGFGNFDGDRVATFRDMDGSVTKCPGDTTWTGPVQIVKPETYIITERCQYRDNWNMVACNDLYGKIRVDIRAVFTGDRMDFKDSGHMRRIRFDNPASVDYESHTGTNKPEYMVILGNNPREFYYEYQLSETTSAFPKRMRFTGKGVERGFGAVVGICLPEGVTRNNIIIKSFMAEDVSYMNSHVQEVDSINDVSDSTYMDTYYMNGRMLYMKFDTWMPRNQQWDKHDTDHCPQGQCPFIEIEFDKEYSYSPCFSPTDAELNSTLTIENLGIPNITCDYPAATVPYEQNWGAGQWMESQDGAWGDWTSWSDCCTDGSSTMTRYRVCDNPPPYGSGATCIGPVTETTACDTMCSVDGQLSEWTAWSECSCGGEGTGSLGSKMRIKECEGLANYGKACSGDLLEMRECRAGCEYGPLP